MPVVRIGKWSPEWRWLKTRKGKARENRNKGRFKDQSEDFPEKTEFWTAQFK